MKHLAFFSFWLVAFILLFFFHTKGYISYDEGWMLNSAKRVLQGEIPYRDFVFIYTPGVIFSLAFIFKILGESILAARILAVITSLVSLFFLYKILSHTTKNKTIIFLSLSPFLLWGPFQINFTWPVMFCIALSLITYYFFLLFNQTKNKNFLFSAGLTTALVLIFKQNLGLAVIINNILIFLLIPKLKDKKLVIPHIAGFATIISIFFIYLYLNGALFIFIDQMYFLLIRKILFEGMLSTPLIYSGPFAYQIIKSFFYLLPLILGGTATYILFKKKRQWFFLGTFVLLFYLLGMRPTTDIVHLAPMLSLTGISLAIIINFSKNNLKTISIGLLFFLIFLGIYSVFFRGYYRWEAPIVQHRQYLNHPRIKIFLDGKYYRILPLLISKIEQETKKDDYIFVYHFSPMTYFISDRRNPTKYDYIPQSLLEKNVDLEIVNQLKLNNVKVVVTENINNDKSKTANFIRNNFKSLAISDDYIFWKR